jgi:C-terminal processing protease CtpA/Prc
MKKPARAFPIAGPRGGSLVSAMFTGDTVGKRLGMELADIQGPGSGVQVVEVHPDSLAHSMGIEVGDRVHEINGQLVPSALGHKHVRERIRLAGRPLHLIFERPAAH